MKISSFILLNFFLTSLYGEENLKSLLLIVEDARPKEKEHYVFYIHLEQKLIMIYRKNLSKD